MHRVFVSVLIAFALPVSGTAGELTYNRDVRPLLSDRCFFCHGPDEDERQADLRLDQEESAKEYAIVPEQPDASEFVSRIMSDDPELVMPPPDSGKSLSREEIKILTDWIRQGAEYQPYWAYVSPIRHAVPARPGSSRTRSWIDAFIFERLQREQLTPAPEADPRTLIRRISFDLTGLPPKPEDVSWFVNAPSDANYETYVDRLLDSDHFGERMAIYWLDLVRYADTVGYHGDQDQNISPYRDWVIDAFNDNLPFDRFTRAQLAGDLLPDAGIDQRIATGYNRLLQTSHEGGVQPREYLAIYMADRIRNFSGVWMAATMGCCQCHNHKFDPFTMKDFYSLQAFFADIDEAQHFKTGSNALPTARPPELEVLAKRDRARLMQIETEIAELEARSKEPVTDSEEEGASSSGSDSGSSPSAARALPERLAQLKLQREQLQERIRKTMITVAIEPREIRLLPRGNWLDDTGPVMSPEVPGFLGALQVTDRRANRLDLANWLTDPATGIGGLTARVQVNRFWYLFFGTGLARILDDFGGQGEPPVHPELLDNLALEFIESGWNVKQIIKQLVMSSTYRLSSTTSPELRERDPYNVLFARQASYRLPAEMVRDQVLAISGLLVLDYGGPSIKPYQPAGYYRHLNFPTREYEADTDSNQWRRGVYMHWQRQFLHPMLAALDAPSREECTVQRPRSNTPLAALVLLNDPSFVEAARVFAERILLDGPDTDASRIDFAFREALFRPADGTEHSLLQALLHQELERYASDPMAAAELLSTGFAPVNDELEPAELAAWTSVARAVLNLNETIRRD